jgi:hypothetical protein
MLNIQAEHSVRSPVSPFPFYVKKFCLLDLIKDTFLHSCSSAVLRVNVFEKAAILIHWEIIWPVMDDDSRKATCQTNVNNKISTVSAKESVTIIRTLSQSI